MLRAFGELEQMERENRRVDEMAAKLRAEEEMRMKKTHRTLVLAIPLLWFGAYFLLQRVIVALSSDLVEARSHLVSRIAEPLFFWFLVVTKLAVGVSLLVVGLLVLWRLLAPNIAVERDASPKSGSRPSH